MQPITSLLITATRKVVKFLQRDFLELEMLQRNNLGNNEFCKKSYIKLKGLLQNELNQYQKCLFFPEDKFDINNNDYKIVFLVNPMDSYYNFTRAIPFFALSITCLKKVQTTLTPVTTIIYFTALNEIYYAEKGKGAWVERDSGFTMNHQGSRLRVSGISNFKNSLTVADDIIVPKGNDIRIFGSPCYTATLLAAGKCDIIYLSPLDYTLYYACCLLITEAGGVITNNDEKFIASNNLLVNKV